MTYVSFENGGIAARWVTDRKENLLFIVLDSDSDIDAASYVLNAVAPSIAGILERWFERGWPSPVPARAELEEE